MIHAHGGLTSEEKGLEYALDSFGFWLGHNVYPLYFVWETGLFGALFGADGNRGWNEFVGETARVAGGLEAWTSMKENAENAASAALPEGAVGGARLVARRLAGLAQLFPQLEIHLVGHSAGAVFHSHFLPVLVTEFQIPVKTLHFLAPAVRVDLFKSTLLNLIGQGIQRFSVFTMTKRAEKKDTTGFVYRKSLLYMIKDHFEPDSPSPILGLQEVIDDDPALTRLFAHNPAAEIHYSPTAMTMATKHTDFDNDTPTMMSVLRRILGVDDQLDIAGRFPGDDRDRGFESEDSRPNLRASGSGTRKALCVGIDRYADQPLDGCVNDARNWGRTLGELGFAVEFLIDGQATRAAMIKALERLVVQASPGDVLVFQYAGHGTQLEDLNGDERDRFDEAFVPIDYQKGAYLLDDDLAAITDRLPAGVNMTWFIDCCHSGTITRFIPPTARGGEKVRFLTATEAMEAAHRTFRAGQPRAASGGLAAAEEQVIHFSACRDEQVALESNGQGDFTRRAVPLLAAAVGAGQSHLELAQQIRRAFGPAPRQEPGLLGRPELLRRAVLAAHGGRDDILTGPIGGSVPSPTFSDEELLAQVEALADQLRRRLGRD